MFHQLDTFTKIGSNMDDAAIKEHLVELNNALDCGYIDEVGITLDPSLPLIVRVESKLGIAKSFLKPMFKYALNKLYLLRKEIHNCSYESELNNISRAVLLVKGDFPIAYDVRKNLVNTGTIEVKTEIPLTTLIFTLHPKCPSGWQHRRWCYASKHKLDSILLNCSEVETEKELCREMAEKHPKNYYAWVHRLWLLQHMTHFQLDDELTFTLNWLQNHVSDHSAVNHRIQVLLRIFSSPSALRYVLNENKTESNDLIVLKLNLLGRVIQESEELVQNRPGHESLWALRRSLVEILFQLISSTSNREVSILSVVGKVQVSQLWIDKLLPNPPSLAMASSCEHNISSSSSPKDTTHDNCVDVNMTLYLQLSSVLTLVQNNQFNTHTEELCCWLQNFVSYEMRLVSLCCDEASIKWDSTAQRQAALRYAAFLLHRLAIYCKTTTSHNNTYADSRSMRDAASGSASTIGLKEDTEERISAANTTFYCVVQAALARVGSALEANKGVSVGIAQSFW